MTAKDRYKSEKDFRMALQDKLLKISSDTGLNIQTLYRQTACSQFLTRLFSIGDDIDWTLKGGHALELRLQQSRATKDIDLTLKTDKIFNSKSEDQSMALRELLLEKSEIDIGDYFNFIVSEPVMDLIATPYGGARFTVEAHIDGKLFSKFTLDVGIGDIWLDSDIIELKNFMPGILSPGKVKVISLEQHCAEKIHAYTLPRDNFNSRVKDLVDLYLIFNLEDINIDKLKNSLEKTFSRRDTHKLPELLQNPHPLWKERFERLIENFDLETDIDSAFSLVNDFYKKVIK